jgi:antitoxin Phd
MINVTSAEAQNSFGKLLDTAQREPVVVTRHGRPTAFIISPQDMAELQDARTRRSKAAEAFDAFFREAGQAKGTRVPTEHEVARMVKASR